MINDWELITTNLGRIQERRIEVAVLPAAAVEAHNRHLPEGQDLLHTQHVARESCRRAFERGAQVMLLPALPFGVDCNQLALPLAVHVSQATLDAMVRDVIASLRRHGIRKIVLVNGHGGNDFVPLVRQVQCDLDVHVFLCNWWTVGHDRYSDFFNHADDHAGQMETAVGLAICPELVELERAGSGLARPFRFEALRKGWIRTSRDFARLNDHCAAGDPSGATAEAGRAYLELSISRIADFLVELAGSPIDEHFPHEGP